MLWIGGPDAQDIELFFSSLHSFSFSSTGVARNMLDIGAALRSRNVMRAGFTV